MQLSNSALYPCLQISSKQEEGWENARQLSRPIQSNKTEQKPIEPNRTPIVRLGSAIEQNRTPILL